MHGHQVDQIEANPQYAHIQLPIEEKQDQFWVEAVDPTIEEHMGSGPEEILITVLESPNDVIS